MEMCPCSQIGRPNIIKVLILSKAIYGFNTFPTKIPMSLSGRNGKPDAKNHGIASDFK